MAIVYPLSLPTVTPILTLGWSARAVVAVSESPFSLSQQVQVHPGQAWGPITVSAPPMHRDAAQEWIGFLLALNGREGTFFLGDPDLTEPRGTIGASNIAAYGVHAVRSRSLTLSGLVPGATVLVGDYVQIGTGSAARLHKAVASATADESGHVTLDIWPGLRTSLAGGEAVRTRACVGVFRMATNEMAWDAGQASIYGVDFKAIEALS